MGCRDDTTGIVALGPMHGKAEVLAAVRRFVACCDGITWGRLLQRGPRRR